MKIDNVRTKAWIYGGKTKVKIEFDIIDMDKWDNDLEFINRKLTYNHWMLEHLVTYCPWDYSFNIRLLADSIKETGKNILENDIFVGSQKTGRRALYAAHLLENCYHDDDIIDHSFENHMKRTEMYSVRIKNSNGMHEMKHKYPFKNAMKLNPREYETKMFGVINKRIQKRIQKKKIQDLEERK